MKAVPRSTLDLAVGWSSETGPWCTAAFCGWVGALRHKVPDLLLNPLLPPSGRAGVSRARRGWRRAWRGGARGRAAAAREVGLRPGRARPTAAAAATAPRTRPPPLGARTGRPGPKASSYPSGMQVLLLKCLGSAGVCCMGCTSASMVSLQLDPYAFG